MTLRGIYKGLWAQHARAPWEWLTLNLPLSQEVEIGWGCGGYRGGMGVWGWGLYFEVLGRESEGLLCQCPFFCPVSPALFAGLALKAPCVVCEVKL